MTLVGFVELVSLTLLEDYCKFFGPFFFFWLVIPFIRVLNLVESLEIGVYLQVLVMIRLAHLVFLVLSLVDL